MCGIVGILLADRDAAVNQELYDGLTMLQHRGQDAAGMVVGDKARRMHIHKDCGLVRDVFKLQHMIKLLGFYGIAHCRYPTAGNSSNVHEAQPFVTHIPFGLCIAHNGNLTNTKEMQQELCHRYHFNTDSDSELMLSVLADELLAQPAPANGASAAAGSTAASLLSPERLFAAARGLMARARGGYAALLMVAGHGVLAFRDPHGIRPLCFGSRASAVGGGASDFVMASESVAIESLGYTMQRDVRPGEAIWFGLDGTVRAQMCHDAPVLSPCVFEYVYFGRPDSIIDGVSVYRARQLMGTYLADKIKRQYNLSDIDVVCPVPDTSRVSAVQCALQLGLPYEEGLTKNRYIARTFIMPGQEKRRANVRKKLNPIRSVFEGKRVLLIDDSIVRGTTSSQIIQMCRDQGALKVYFCSASPPVRYPNVYGIDMPVQSELIAYGRDEVAIAKELGADWVVFSDIEDMKQSVLRLSEEAAIGRLDCSCFDGEYVTGDIDEAYFERLKDVRSDARLMGPIAPTTSASAADAAAPAANGRANGGQSQLVHTNGDLSFEQVPEESSPSSADPAADPAAAGEERDEVEVPASALNGQRRGRQIAGINKHVSNDDYRRLKDRFSGWS
ncbi:amidophosphoribosyltransferase [Tribonema minus]|uniref:amidophosphoribosyltransferase n=1 Tax=Tribonema minus TaxID=303371 RepID=A0A835YP19_9STRA|nr:amidophosphoribosyltransferase [Tribonema minus]